jgi:type II secretory pathway pseudopilin PulG
MRRRSAQAAGFTLIEALIACVILAMVVAGITMPFAAGARSEAHDARLTLATQLAQEMIEEIMSRPFDDPDGVDVGETRLTFDDMDDYNIDEPDGQIRDARGEPMYDLAAAGLSRHTTCSKILLTGQPNGDTPDYVRATVEVRYRSQPLVRLVRLICAH